MNKDTINIIKILLLPLVSFLVLMGVIGGLLYFYFPREDKIGENIIITTCIELGGEPQWAEWPNRCGERGEQKCYFETCVLPKLEPKE